MKMLGVNGGVVMQFEHMDMYAVGENHDASAASRSKGKQWELLKRAA